MQFEFYFFWLENKPYELFFCAAFYSRMSLISSVLGQCFVPNLYWTIVDDICKPFWFIRKSWRTVE